MAQDEEKKFEPDGADEPEIDPNWDPEEYKKYNYSYSAVYNLLNGIIAKALKDNEDSIPAGKDEEVEGLAEMRQELKMYVVVYCTAIAEEERAVDGDEKKDQRIAISKIGKLLPEILAKIYEKRMEGNK